MATKYRAHHRRRNRRAAAAAAAANTTAASESNSLTMATDRNSPGAAIDDAADAQSPLPSTEFRTRRAHAKSRNGCTRCKQQRKKCDEAKPSCTRCAARNYRCEYVSSGFDVPPRPSPSPHRRGGDMPLRLESLSLSPSASSLSVPVFEPSWAFGGDGSDGWLSPSSGSVLGSLSPWPSVGGFEEPTPAPQTYELLGAKELELLSHFITHTSRAVAFDDADYYALHVGMPNMAFRCTAVMSSLLALASACQCQDILQHTSMSSSTTSSASTAPMGDLTEIQALLDLGEKHHQASLRQTQATLPAASRYDGILANAALMVLSTQAAQSVRVRLALDARARGVILPADLMPGHSRWISLIRAAHAAFDGLLRDPRDAVTAASPGDGGIELGHESFSSAGAGPSASTSLQAEPETRFGENGPSEATGRLFFPVVASTCNDALQRLHDKAQALIAAENSFGYDIHGSEELQHTLQALKQLNFVVKAVFSKDETPTPGSQRWSHGQAFPPLGSLRGVSPWLRAYIGRVTSASPTKALRRIIMSFVNRVPVEYLNMVQPTLDRIPTEPGLGDSPGPWDVMDAELSQPSEAHKLAMDVFAHWLVMVMLLDGVWWIGDIGQWELGRVISLLRTERWLGLSSEPGQRWWPESMYTIRGELVGQSK